MSSLLAIGRAQVLPAEHQFVQREGNRFVLDGNPFRFTGANFMALQDPQSRAGIPVGLDGAATAGMKVLRVWAFKDCPAREPSHWDRRTCFRMGPDGWIEESFVALDRLLAEARDRQIRVVLVLANQWGDFGGIPQYYEWFNSTPRPVEKPVTRVQPLAAEIEFFYKDLRAREAYRANLIRLTDRINTVNGIPYREDPTLMAYELMNEPRIEAVHQAEQFEWNRMMAVEIRRRAPRQLIASGIDTGLSRLRVLHESWMNVGGLSEIDYLDLHLYPGAFPGTSPMNWAELSDRLQRVSRFAHERLGKPVVLSEIGYSFHATSGFTGVEIPRLQRIAIADPGHPLHFLQRTMEDALLVHGFDGALLWRMTVTETHDENPQLINPLHSAMLPVIVNLRGLSERL